MADIHDTRHEIVSRVRVLEATLFSALVDEGKLQAAFRAMDELWDASGGSDIVARAMADDEVIGVLIRMLISTSYLDVANIDEIREIAANILVNVSSLPPGAAALCKVRDPHDGIFALLSLIQEIDSTSSTTLCLAGTVAIEVLSNVALSGPPGRAAITAPDGVKAILQAVATCPDHPPLKEAGFKLISHICLDESGCAAAVDAQAHRALFASLLQTEDTPNAPGRAARRISTSQPGGRRGSVIAADPPAAALPLAPWTGPTAPAQAQALRALRNLSAWGPGRRALLGASRAAVAGVCAMLHSDTPDAVEDAAAVVCNLLQPDPSGRAREPIDPRAAAPLLAPIVNIGHYLTGLRAAPVAVAAMANMAATARGRAALLGCRAHVLLAGLLRCGGAVAADVREAAALALLNLSQSADGRRAVNLETGVAERAGADLLCAEGGTAALAALGAALLRNLTADGGGEAVLDAWPALAWLLAFLAAAAAALAAADAAAAAGLARGGPGDGGEEGGCVDSATLEQVVGCVRNLAAMLPQGPVRLLYCHHARKFRPPPPAAAAAGGGEAGRAGGDDGSLVGDLIRVLRSGKPAAATAAAAALGNLACVDAGAAALRAAGAEQALLDAVGLDRDPAVHHAAAGTLRSLLGAEAAGDAIQAAVRRSRRRSGSAGEVRVSGEQAVTHVASLYPHALLVGRA